MTKHILTVVTNKIMKKWVEIFKEIQKAYIFNTGAI